MSPESSGIERHAGLETALNTAHKKALEMLQGDAISPEEFEDVYTQEEIERDITMVDRLEKKFAEQEQNLDKRAREAKIVASIFEMIVYEAGELHGWFGDSATTTIPSRFDDIVNGVDVITAFAPEEDEGASYLGLAIDVTSDPNLTSKFLDIKRALEDGHFSKVKYFKDIDDNHITDFEMPRVVIGTDAPLVRELIGQWVEGNKKMLAENEMQLKILIEIREQLRNYITFVREDEREDLATTLEHSMSIIDGILKQKGLGAPSVFAEYARRFSESDTVFREILAHASEFSRKREG